ncbi:hypothetical protein V1477_002428 [Vespula maculifrons]|uniref:Uncharacterized protein n=1 Tax=Vespula maculifrons TaxID=7453 RepID=A0ABD2CWG4_VESMC
MELTVGEQHGWLLTRTHTCRHVIAPQSRVVPTQSRVLYQQQHQQQQQQQQLTPVGGNEMSKDQVGAGEGFRIRSDSRDRTWARTRWRIEQPRLEIQPTCNLTQSNSIYPYQSILLIHIRVLKHDRLLQSGILCQRLECKDNEIYVKS